MGAATSLANKIVRRSENVRKECRPVVTNRPAASKREMTPTIRCAGPAMGQAREVSPSESSDAVVCVSLFDTTNVRTQNVQKNKEVVSKQ
jgi:hypothetical protein